MALLFGTEADIREGEWHLLMVGHGQGLQSIQAPRLYLSYITNIKKLVEMEYMHHQRCEIDRRSVRVRLTPRGRQIRDVVTDLFGRHAEGLQAQGVLGLDGIDQIASSLRRVERYWTDQIRYIY